MLKKAKIPYRYWLIISMGIAGWFFYSPVSASAAGNIVAKVEKETITRTDFINEWELQDRPVLATSTTETSQAEKLKVLNQLIDRRLLFLQAEKENITADAKLIEQMITAEKMNFASTAEFQKALQKKKFTLKEYRDYLADDLRMRQLLIRYVYSRVTVTDLEVNEYYTVNSAKYSTPEQIKLRSIFVKVPATATWEEKGDKLAKAKLALMQLKLGSAFEDVARTISDSENAVRGGDAGYVSRAMLQKEPELEEVAFSLSVGEISEVIETKYGYYILKVEGKIEGRGKRIWEVRERIRNDLLRERNNEQYTKFIDGLRKQYPIELYPENLP
ncbi:MAG: peptidylprolyl isomerase [bacterium]|nr:peptidylprolyl isomerase [bacterium]